MSDLAISLSVQPRYRLLYVGHELNLLKSLQDALKAEGWFVVRCPGGSLARVLLESEIHYDLLIFDDELPSTSGLELVGLARSLEHRALTPIILLSFGDCALDARLENRDVEHYPCRPEHLYVLRKQSVV
jgi:DNA-binding response OmpR family regulator